MKNTIFTLIQISLKCFICIACLLLAYSLLSKTLVIGGAIDRFLKILNWQNYIKTLIWITGIISGIIWQTVYEYKQAVRRKNNIQRIEK